MAVLRYFGKRRLAAMVLLAAVSLVHTLAARAFSFNLDSIAAMGRFPKFCIDTYRWGDHFFNGYDTAYVAPAGYKFNVKLRTNSWLDHNTFRMDNNTYQMNMVSYPSTSAGLWLTYMAVSVGYDINVSNLLGLTHSSRKRFNFQFNCMLFAAELWLQNSNTNMRISRFGPVGDTHRVHIPIDGIETRSWGLETYYFFNHKHYSQAAAFNYSRIQRRSSGSLYAGLSFTGQSFNFDFSKLPSYILEEISSTWPDYRYDIHVQNYAFKLGYGYNWVLSKKCIIGISEAPSVGIRYGNVNDTNQPHTTFYAYNQFRCSFIYNHRHWFAGIVGEAQTNLFSDHDHTLLTNNLQASVSVGYRFNLW